MRAAQAQSRGLVLRDIFTLQSHEVASHWHRIEPFLALVEKRDWTSESVKARLESASAQLWGVREGSTILLILITAIEEPPTGKRGLLWIAAGAQLSDGLRFFREYCEPWLIASGCKSIRIIGRRGWGKVLPDYEEAATVFEREVK